MSAFSVTVHHGPFLLLVATGEGLVCDALGMVDMAARIVEVQGNTRVLFDSIAARFHMTPEEAELLGQHVASKLAGLERVASVVQARSEGQVGERAAQDAGLNIRTFTDLGAGMDWLGSK